MDVEGRGAEMDDYVVVDYKGTIDGKPVHDAFPKAGKPLSGNEDFWIQMTHEAFFPGYGAALVGANVGRDAEVRHRRAGGFPGEGHAGAEDPLRGHAEGDQGEGAAGAERRLRRHRRRRARPSPNCARWRARNSASRRSIASRSGEAQRDHAPAPRAGGVRAAGESRAHADRSASSTTSCRKIRCAACADDVLQGEREGTRRHRRAERAGADQGHLRPPADRREGGHQGDAARNSLAASRSSPSGTR